MAQPIAPDDDGDAQQCWGRTPDGQTFPVPITRDMMHNLFVSFPPRFTTHSRMEMLTLAVAFVMGATFLALRFIFYDGLPLFIKCWFCVVFLCWRAAYNIGLGFMLKWQSESRWFAKLCKQSGWFDRETAEKSDSGKRWHAFIRDECSIKMGPEYHFTSVPVEFNSWLMFRRVVDLILVNDFTAYIIFALSFTNFPAWSDFGWLELLRYVGGFILMAFNVWVKRDAHRVVKDFAWYWGDFFFLVDKNLTFDGVFEMAPHPMYSIGYAGYYGLSLISNSYVVFFVSLLAHSAQFAFLMLVEEPHIQKTYGDSSSLGTIDPQIREILYGKTPHRAYFRRDLIVFQNFDWFRSNDIFLSYAVFLSVLLVIPLPSLYVPPWFFIVMSAGWSLAYKVGLGLLLRLQSERKLLVRHFIKHGSTHRDAFSSWKGIYNFALTMSYLWFGLAAWKMYSIPTTFKDIFYGDFLLRHIFGILLILLHFWMSRSVFSALGDFGWFYGDFFIDEFPSKLHYTGIYRYLNNPEKILGCTSLWGMTIMSGNGVIFLLTLINQLGTWWFLEFVETPHMEKLYGSKIRKESGVTKTFKNQISGQVKRTLEKRKVVSEVNKVLSEINKLGTDVSTKVERLITEGLTDKVKGEIEKVLDLARPKIDELVAETKSMVADSTARLATLGTLGPLAGAFESPDQLLTGNVIEGDISKYSVHLPVTASSTLMMPSSPGCVGFELGDPITIYWTAPSDHSPKDWIGIYKVTSNPSKAATTFSSKGCWQYVGCEGQVAGKLVFEGETLPWDVGVYEIRYHYNDKYLVLAYTGIFEIQVTAQPSLEDGSSLSKSRSLAENETIAGLVEDPGDSNSPDLPEDHPNSYKTVVDALLPLYRKALMCPQLTDTMDFRLHGKGTEKHAKRIANAIKLVFGIEFNWKVVMYLEPTVERMVHRLQEARIVLAPSRLDLSDENESAGKSGSLPIVEVTESSENRPRRISHSGENRSARQRIRSMSGQEKAKQLEIIEKEQLRRYSSRSPPRTRLTDRKVSEVIAGHECGDN